MSSHAVGIVVCANASSSSSWVEWVKVSSGTAMNAISKITGLSAVHSNHVRDFRFGTLIYHRKSQPADEKSSLKGAWSGSVDPC